MQPHQQRHIAVGDERSQEKPEIAERLSPTSLAERWASESSNVATESKRKSGVPFLLWINEAKEDHKYVLLSQKPTSPPPHISPHIDTYPLLRQHERYDARGDNRRAELRPGSQESAPRVRTAKNSDKDDPGYMSRRRYSADCRAYRSKMRAGRAGDEKGGK